MSKKINIKLIALVIILVALPILGFGCKFSQSDEVTELYKPIKLNWWGTWEETDNVSSLIAAYQIIHPNITIKYKKFRYDEYEDALTKAWLEQRGPDIFSIPSSQIREYQSLIKPMPSSMRLPFAEEKSAINSEIIVTIKTVNGLTPKKISELFVPPVYDQVVIDNEIYGLPLSVDTLALYYNRDLLNSAKLPLPASTWSELIEQIEKLTLFNDAGQIQQATIALGAANNIPNSEDILSLLMMQNGAQMTDRNNYITFNEAPPGQNRFYPGKDALEFFVDFVTPTKEVYSWTEEMPNALQVFTSGKLAYFIGYSYQSPIIKAQSPKLNFNIAPMLQTVPDVQEINFADFWTLGVYFGTTEENIDPAWDFIKYITTTPEVTLEYLNNSQQPTALRSLIGDQTQTDSLGIFAEQTLNAKTWYKGYNYEVAKQAMKDLISGAYHDISENLTTLELLNLTVQKINQTIKKQ